MRIELSLTSTARSFPRITVCKTRTLRAAPGRRGRGYGAGYSLTLAGAGVSRQKRSTGVSPPSPCSCLCASGHRSRSRHTRSASTERGEISFRAGLKRRSAWATRLRICRMALKERCNSGLLVLFGQVRCQTIGGEPALCPRAHLGVAAAGLSAYGGSLGEFTGFRHQNFLYIQIEAR